MTNLVPSRRSMERETGLEPATPSLEGWRSSAELVPPVLPMRSISRVEWRQVVWRGGFEPPKAFASRFTVCPLWPLGYLPACTPDCNPLIILALAGGFEPPTHCLQGSCSTPELRQQSQTLTLGLAPHQVKGFLSSSLFPASLAEHLVAEDGRRRRHVQRFEPATHRQAHQEVAGLGHQGTKPLALPTQHQAHRPGQIQLPRQLPAD